MNFLYLGWFGEAPASGHVGIIFGGHPLLGLNGNPHFLLGGSLKSSIEPQAAWAVKTYSVGHGHRFPQQTNPTTRQMVITPLPKDLLNSQRSTDPSNHPSPYNLLGPLLMPTHASGRPALASETSPAAAHCPDPELSKPRGPLAWPSTSGPLGRFSLSKTQKIAFSDSVPYVYPTCTGRKFPKHQDLSFLPFLPVFLPFLSCLLRFLPFFFYFCSCSFLFVFLLSFRSL